MSDFDEETGVFNFRSVRLQMLAHILLNNLPTHEELRIWYRMVDNLAPNTEYSEHTLTEDDLDALVVRLKELA